MEIVVEVLKIQGISELESCKSSGLENPKDRWWGRGVERERRAH